MMSANEKFLDPADKWGEFFQRTSKRRKSTLDLIEQRAFEPLVIGMDKQRQKEFARILKQGQTGYSNLNSVLRDMEDFLTKDEYVTFTNLLRKIWSPTP